MEPVFEYLKQEVGLTVLAWLIIIAILVTIVWKAGQRYALYKNKADNLPCDKHDDSLKIMSEKVSKMESNPCVRHDREIKDTDEKLRRIDLSMGKIEERLDGILTKIDCTPCDRHDREIKKVDEGIHKIDVSSSKIEARLDGMYDMVRDLSGSTRSAINGIYDMVRMMAGSPQSSSLTQSHSPVSLTPLGTEISEKLGFSKLIDDGWTKIESIIGKETNPYDIQMEFIAKFITDVDRYIDAESLDRIKRDAYLRGLPLIDYMRVLGVMARDKYFACHNIDVSEVDKNDPNR